MTLRPHPAAALTEAALRQAGIDDLSTALGSIVQAVGQVVPRTHVSIVTTDGAGAWKTLAASDPMVLAFDAMQCELDEGPSLTAMRETRSVIVENAESEHRWPRFIARAVDAGLASQAALPIHTEGQTLGVLNTYSTTHGHIDRERLAHAKLFATQATIAMNYDARQSELTRALASSRNTGTAVGITMERYDMGSDQAFSFLRRISQQSNMDIGDVAAHFVEQSNALSHGLPMTDPSPEQER